MGVDTGDSKFTIITKPKNFHYGLPKDIDKNLEHEIDYIITHNELLAEHAIKNGISHYCLNIRMETMFMNMENSKTNEPHKFVLNLSQRLDL